MSVRYMLCFFLLLAAAPSLQAQLQITEIMYDPASSDSEWEWVEVRNNSASAIDLNGYVLSDAGTNQLGAPNIVNIDPGGNANTTMIPAGGVAILYDASAIDNPDGSYNPTRFRNPWQLSPNVPLIGLNLPALNNGSDFVGLWSDLLSYEMDLGDVNGDMRVVQFDNATAWIDYREPTFPGASGESIHWNGTGNYQDGNQWVQTVNMEAGAYESIPTTIDSSFNSTLDVANPGLLSAGAASAGLLITEIMYNPNSDEPDWEFVEVFNNTGSTIDFGSTPHYFDDLAGTLGAANLTQGSIADGEVAILFNGSNNNEMRMETAWGTNNYIPVDEWPQLNNGGDLVAIWDNQADYDGDRLAGNADNSVINVTYDDDGTDWPFDNNMASIYLDDLDGDPNTGTNWMQSFFGDAVGSGNANPVMGSVPDHAGGDVGSPGFVPSGNPTVDGDFDDNGLYECADVDALVATIVAGNNDPNFDLNSDGVVDITDLDLWRTEAGAVLNASGNPILTGDANLDGSVDGQDFIAWNNNKFQNLAAWCSGDFNADGAVDGQDFIVWNNNKFTSADGVQGVPEPAGATLLVTLLMGLVWRRKN